MDPVINTLAVLFFGAVFYYAGTKLYKQYQSKKALKEYIPFSKPHGPADEDD